MVWSLKLYQFGEVPVFYCLETLGRQGIGIMKLTQLLKEKKPVRITTSKIGKRLGILANLERHLDKLPKTNKFLKEITESVQDFQARRCYKIIDGLFENNEPILLWQVQRVTAIKSHHFHEIKPLLESYIEMKRGVKKDERTTS